MGASLASLLDSLISLADRDAAYRNEQHMNKVFAANPQFASQLYGARQNEAENQRAQRAMALEEQEIARKRQQREALSNLARSFGTQESVDPTKALTEFAALTGDTSDLADLFVAREKAKTGIDAPAAIKIANEIQNARATGNVQRLNDIVLAAKMFDRGVVVDPSGTAQVMGGYPDVLTTLEEAKQTGSNISDLTYKPQIAGGEAMARLEQELNVAPQIEEEKKRAQVKVEKESEKPRALSRVNAIIGKSQNLNETIDRAISKTSNKTAGFGALLSGIPLTESKDFAEDLKTIKANLGFDELQEMRMNSPTGGALGQVAVQEIEFLQSVVASLEQSQSPEQLKSNLEKIKRAKAESDERIRQAYVNEYEKKPSLSVDDLGLSDMSDEDILKALGVE